MTTNYFKVASTGRSRGAGRPPAVQTEVFPFDDFRPESVRSAFSAAEARRQYLEENPSTVAKTPRLSVWKPPRFAGPWDGVPEVGVPRFALLEFARDEDD